MSDDDTATDGPADEATDIRTLDQSTIERIAAGEVVERPASAVKELVENSLDADASRVEVRVEAGGTEGIVVRDDGEGMTEADVRAAVREHTTSKIRDIDDLESGVATLGFRGEALHAIGAVSRLTIRTRPRGSEDVGTALVYAGGEVESVERVGCPEGTTVEVTDLFFNTPARKKYLKTEATEFGHVNRVVTQYALANPDVAVSLSHDGRETFATPGQGGLQSTVMSVYGREVAEAMIPVDRTFEDGPIDRVRGLVSHPETNRSTREYLSTFVNDRYVTSSTAREAVVDAYGGQLAGDRYPFAAVFLELPAGEVDVNVHPRKMAVRFGESEAVRHQVRTAIEEALVEHGLVRSSAPRGRSQAEETEVAPDRVEDESTDRKAVSGSAESGTDRESVARDRDDIETERSETNDATASPSERRAAGDTSKSDSDHRRIDGTAEGESSAGSADPKERDDASGTGSTAKADSPPSSETATTADDSTAADQEPTVATADHKAASGDGQTDGRISGGTDQRTLDGEAVDRSPEFDTLPSLRVLGQVHDTYVVCETEDGLALIDQHAADERINYERLTETFADDTTAQALADPVTMSLTAGEAAAFDAHREALERLGFRASLTDDRRVEVTAVPAVFSETLPPETLRDVLDSFLSADRDGETAVEALADDLVADLACYPSITGNTSLTEGSVMDLLQSLDECDNPYACPHGRPVIVQIDRDEIEDRFERDYPGHQ
ncbi:MAG: DNA mismatch repair protein MutL [Halobacteriales archaeon]